MLIFSGLFANHRRPKHDSRFVHFPSFHLQTFSLGTDETSPSETGPALVQTVSLSKLRVRIDSSWNGGHRNRKPSRPASHDGFQRKWKNADSSFVGAERREQNREGWIQGNPSLRRTLYLDVVWVNSKHYQIPNS